MSVEPVTSPPPNATASFPMYDHAEVHGALDIVWAGVVRHLREQGVTSAPQHLTHGRALHALWADPGLFVSQCCGYDLVNRYAGEFRVIATPLYTAPGCEGPWYASAVIVAEEARAADIEDMRGGVCAINGEESHSGMNALRALVAPLQRDGKFFSAVRATGSHAGSISLVARGEADVAAIDCVTHALLARHRPRALAGTRILGFTERAPGIPYISRANLDPDLFERLRNAFQHAFDDADVKAAAATLFVGGVQVLAPSAYDRISQFQTLAATAGYSALR